MRHFLACCFLLMSVISFAQVKSPDRKFSLPAKISPRDYASGKVLVKLNEKYKATFQSANTSARGSQTLAGGKLKALAPSGSSSRNTSGRARAFKPAVDISLYYEVSFDPSQSVEDFINTLYASGYVDIAEPVYRERVLETPNDEERFSQYYLDLIHAYEAWDITKGSEDIIIAIIDSGVDIDHPDLAPQLFINTADPVNNIDDDHNGFVDDYHGWDFSGDDTLNVFNPNYKGDNEPAINKLGPGFNHGTQVGSCAGAATNNTIGMAGVGYKSKLLFTKHFADNQKASSRSYSSDLYDGILYAASMGAKIINCSWGSYYPSQIRQDIITHVTLDLGSLVIAAAGNDGIKETMYPAAYEYVLSVGSTDDADTKASFSNYGNVDIVAPGTGIFTASYNDSFSPRQQGTSFSSPIVAGAAALVAAHFPSYSPLQIAEKIRVTADASIYDMNPEFLYKLGKGRLNVLKALTESSPALRAQHYVIQNANGSAAGPGDNALLFFDFKNYLESTSGGLQITISSSSASVTITKETVTPGVIASGATVRNSLTPFELIIHEDVPENTPVELLITYSDGAYQDFQLFTFIPNPSFITIDDNRITTTLTSSGRIGYEDTERSANGNGFVYNNTPLLFEMGVIMGSSSSTILNTVRNGSGGYDQDFVSIEQIKEIIPGERSYAEVFGKFSNNVIEGSQQVQVSYRSLVWREAPYDKFIILEYTIKNPTETTIDNFHLGIFADWDISFNGAGDAARWDEETKIGYVFPKQSSSLPHAGIQLLKGPAHYYAIDNNPNLVDNPFGIYDGYTDGEKFTSLSTSRLEAGSTVATGNDVSHVVSAGPYTIESQEEITIAFALHANDNLTELLTSAHYADSVYNFTLTAASPHVDTVETCYGSSGELEATGASKFRWYRDFTGGEPIATGPTLTIPELFNDTTLYVSNATHSYESLRTPAHLAVKARPLITTSRSPILCEGESIVLSVDEGNTYTWSTGSALKSITVNSAGDYSVDITYNNGTLNCHSQSEVVSVSVLPRPTAHFTSDNGFIEDQPFQFTDKSEDASKWFWSFDDGATSEEQNPLHLFARGGDFDVKLTVTSANGCQDHYIAAISVITSLEKPLDQYIQYYPNPLMDDDLTITAEGLNTERLHISLITIQGKELYQHTVEPVRKSYSHVIHTDGYAPGLYILKVRVDEQEMTRKIILYK